MPCSICGNRGHNMKTCHDIHTDVFKDFDDDLFNIRICDEDNIKEDMEEKTEELSIITIQKIYRGYNFRKKRLPIFLCIIQKFMSSNNIVLSKFNNDGRINSCKDEDIIKQILIEKYKDRIEIPKELRMWYDILIYDLIYGWLPVNIKTTTMKVSDNSGGLSMCVYSYTNEILDLRKSYNNGPMSKLLIQKFKEKKYNYNNKKDYYFLVVNKNNTNEVIINSCKGLSNLTPNSNNLPFQINWSKNKEYNFTSILHSVNKLIKCIQRPKPSWTEDFVFNMRTLSI